MQWLRKVCCVAPSTGDAVEQLEPAEEQPDATYNRRSLTAMKGGTTQLATDSISPNPGASTKANDSGASALTSSDAGLEASGTLRTMPASADPPQAVGRSASRRSNSNMSVSEALTTRPTVWGSQLSSSSLTGTYGHQLSRRDLVTSRHVTLVNDCSLGQIPEDVKLRMSQGQEQEQQQEQQQQRQPPGGNLSVAMQGLKELLSELRFAPEPALPPPLVLGSRGAPVRPPAAALGAVATVKLPGGASSPASGPSRTFPEPSSGGASATPGAPSLGRASRAAGDPASTAYLSPVVAFRDRAFRRSKASPDVFSHEPTAKRPTLRPRSRSFAGWTDARGAASDGGCGGGGRVHAQGAGDGARGGKGAAGDEGGVQVPAQSRALPPHLTTPPPCNVAQVAPPQQSSSPWLQPPQSSSSRLGRDPAGQPNQQSKPRLPQKHRLLSLHGSFLHAFSFRRASTGSSLPPADSPGASTLAGAAASAAAAGAAAGSPAAVAVGTARHHNGQPGLLASALRAKDDKSSVSGARGAVGSGASAGGEGCEADARALRPASDPWVRARVSKPRVRAGAAAVGTRASSWDEGGWCGSQERKRSSGARGGMGVDREGSGEGAARPEAAREGGGADDTGKMARAFSHWRGSTDSPGQSPGSRALAGRIRRATDVSEGEASVRDLATAVLHVGRRNSHARGPLDHDGCRDGDGGVSSEGTSGAEDVSLVISETCRDAYGSSGSRLGGPTASADGGSDVGRVGKGDLVGFEFGTPFGPAVAPVDTLGGAPAVPPVPYLSPEGLRISEAKGAADAPLSADTGLVTLRRATSTPSFLFTSSLPGPPAGLGGGLHGSLPVTAGCDGGTREGAPPSTPDVFVGGIDSGGGVGDHSLRSGGGNHSGLTGVRVRGRRGPVPRRPSLVRPNGSASRMLLSPASARLRAQSLQFRSTAEWPVVSGAVQNVYDRVGALMAPPALNGSASGNLPGSLGQAPRSFGPSPHLPTPFPQHLHQHSHHRQAAMLQARGYRTSGAAVGPFSPSPFWNGPRWPHGATGVVTGGGGGSSGGVGGSAAGGRTISRGASAGAAGWAAFLAGAATRGGGGGGGAGRDLQPRLLRAASAIGYRFSTQYIQQQQLHMALGAGFVHGGGGSGNGGGGGSSGGPNGRATTADGMGLAAAAAGAAPPPTSNRALVSAYLVNGRRHPMYASKQVSQMALLPFTSQSGSLLLPQLSPHPPTLNMRALSRELTALRLIGQGGGGAVFQGLWRGVPVAVKFLVSQEQEHEGSRDGAADAAVLEGVVGCVVHHPNVLHTFAYECTRLTEAVLEDSDTVQVGVEEGGTELLDSLMDSCTTISDSMSGMRRSSVAPSATPQQLGNPAGTTGYPGAGAGNTQPFPSVTGSSGPTGTGVTVPVPPGIPCGYAAAAAAAAAAAGGGGCCGAAVVSGVGGNLPLRPSRLGFTNLGDVGSTSAVMQISSAGLSRAPSVIQFLSPSTGGVGGMASATGPASADGAAHVAGSGGTAGAGSCATGGGAAAGISDGSGGRADPPARGAMYFGARIRALSLGLGLVDTGSCGGGGGGGHGGVPVSGWPSHGPSGGHGPCSPSWALVDDPEEQVTFRPTGPLGRPGPLSSAVEEPQGGAGTGAGAAAAGASEGIFSGTSMSSPPGVGVGGAASRAALGQDRASTNRSTGGRGSVTSLGHMAAGGVNRISTNVSFQSEDGFGDPEAACLSSYCWCIRQVLGYLKARPGMLMTYIIMEYCDRGSLLTAIKRGVFRPGGLHANDPADTGTGGGGGPAAGARASPASPPGGAAVWGAPAGGHPSGISPTSSPGNLHPPFLGSQAHHAAGTGGPNGKGQEQALMLLQQHQQQLTQRHQQQALYREQQRAATAARLALRAVLRTARDVAQGMSHLHANGIIHGDLKPGNVLLRGCRTDRRGFVAVVSDFGLSKVTRGDKPLELNHWSTVTVMAPEVIMGRWLKASDVFSFGILLWQLVTGEMMPYGKCTVPQILMGVSQGTLKPEWPASCHPALSRLGRACLATSPQKRPSFEAIVKMLTKIEKDVRKQLLLSPSNNNHTA